MYDTSPRTCLPSLRYMIESVSRYLAVANHHVVAAAGLGIDPHLAQHEHHHIYISVEGKSYCLILCDIGEHDVAHIGINASSPTLAAIGLYATLTAKLYVHLIFNKLIASENYTWLHLPHKKAILLVYVVCYIFLHGEVERQFSGLLLRQ